MMYTSYIEGNNWTMINNGGKLVYLISLIAQKSTCTEGEKYFHNL